MSRPTVTVYSASNPTESTGTVGLPTVFTAPIRNDIVHFVHSNISKNRLQPMAVSKKAGKQCSAHSWGTGRAVSRIPRVGGSGTHRSGQAAYGNMCRGGHMFAPLKVWRKWGRKVNLNQRRHAIASAIAATAVGPLVLARGHRVSHINEIPFVVDSLNIEKTSALIKTLVALGVGEELRRVNDSKKIRTGRGKLRNRRYVMRKGPLIVIDDTEADQKVIKAARNIPGVEVANVNRLNLLKLAPGGHLGRFVIWTKPAFEALNEVFGSYKRTAAGKHGYTLQRNIINSADLSRWINSDQIQNIIKDPKSATKRHLRKINPLNNKGVMHRLNPFHAKKIAAEQKSQAVAATKRAAVRKAKRTSKVGKARHATALKVYRDISDAQVKRHDQDKKAYYDEIAAQVLESSDSD